MSQTSMTTEKLRAPKSNGGVLVSPNAGFQQLIAENQSSLRREFLVGTIPSKELRSLAKSELLQLAHLHTQSYCDELIEHPKHSLVFVSGHQPEFFHPGVWFKNFLLDGLAKKYGGTAINLIIDNDECKSTTLSVLGGSKADPRLEKFQYDSPAKLLPFENRAWTGIDVAKRFHAAIKKQFDVGKTKQLILDDVWPSLLDSIESNESLVGTSIAASRHMLERKSGVVNLEVPLSHVCRGKAFQIFLAGILQSAECFHETYNEAIFRYRTANRIRSKARPVPELVRSGDWIELPFWIWSQESPKRGPLYCQSKSDGDGKSVIQISDLDSIHFEFDSDSLVEGLSRINGEGADSGAAIRPRALLTTMFARLFLSDVFIHGIGGAKYDDLTDDIIRTFFEIEPPQYITATSTHWLPVGFQPPLPAEIAAAKQRVRDEIFHAEKSITAIMQVADPNGDPGIYTSEIFELVRRKDELLVTKPKKGSRKQWHREILEVNEKLAIGNSVEIENAQSQLAKLLKQAKSAAILCSREFSFLLHPKSVIGTLQQQVDEVLINAN